MVDGIIVRIVRAVQVSGRSKNQSTKVNWSRLSRIYIYFFL